jgi:PKD repeat protein
MDYQINIPVVDRHPKLVQIETTLQGLRDKLTAYADREIVGGSEVQYKEETKALLLSFEEALETYKTACATIKEETHTKADAQKMHEKRATLLTKISSWQEDTSIGNLEAVPAYKKTLELIEDISTRMPLLETAGFVPSIEAPVASFTSEFTVVEAGNTIQFTDLSTNNPTKREWTFTNGAISKIAEGETPTVLFETAGNYDVKLKASNGFGVDEDIKIGFITVAEVAE